MKKKLFISSSLVIIIALTSCSRTDGFEDNANNSNNSNINIETLDNAFEAFKNKFSKNSNSSMYGRVYGMTEKVEGDEYIISYTEAEIVGNPSDEIIMSYGPVVQATTLQEEEETRLVLQDDILDAKNYLLNYGLDFSQEYTADDHRYLLTAMLVKDLEKTGQLSTNGNVIGLYGRQNTLAGCIFQAIGINNAINIWYDKYATKRLLLQAVGKLATRYLGYVGAAIAVYDFADCMWGD